MMEPRLNGITLVRLDTKATEQVRTHGHRCKTHHRQPQQRESYLTGWVSIAEPARRAAGRLDFAIPANLLDPGAASTSSSARSRKRPARPQQQRP
jgi:hypothetical protein